MSNDPVTQAASSALQELLEVSPQVDAAVILERDGGRLVASAHDKRERMSDQLGATAIRILEAAEQARQELGREPVSQIEVSTPDGHVFVVSDVNHVVVAVTSADPTVGLVFYDLKTALRSVRESHAGQSNGAPSVVIPVSAEIAGDGDSSNGATASSSSEKSEGRWRRRKS